MLLREARATLVYRRTANLETDLYAVPEVVCYWGIAISFQIDKWIITIQYICLINLIMNREVLKDLVQEWLTEKNITDELHIILKDVDKKSQLKKDYVALRKC